MNVALSELRVGDKAKILGFNPGKVGYLQRLLSMGLVPEMEFVVARVAPLGDPVEIKMNHFSLCVRKHEGSILQLERVK